MIRFAQGVLVLAIMAATMIDAVHL